MDEFNTRKPMNLRRRGIYLLPNLFTTGALFAGFYAIVQAMNNRFEFAAVAIFIAMVLDGLDGRVARLTRTQSEFGAEYDSLADVVAFGAAPALVMYEWALRPRGRRGGGAVLLCRHDGHEHPLLQLQGHQLPPQRAVLGGPGDRPRADARLRQ